MGIICAYSCSQKSNYLKFVPAVSDLVGVSLEPEPDIKLAFSLVFASSPIFSSFESNFSFCED